MLKDPIVTPKTIPAHGLPVSGFWFLSCFLTGGGPLRFVQPLKFCELTKIFEDMLLALAVKPEVTNRFNGANERENVLQTLFAKRDGLCRNPVIGSTKIEDLHSLPYSGEILLKINLQAPRWQLERELEILIRTLHKNLPLPEGREFPELAWKPRKKKRFTPAQKPITKSALIEHKILPFLDLLIWEEENRLTIADATKSRMLFPQSGKGMANSGKSWTKNWIREAESLAWSVLTYNDFSYFDLERRAEEELQNAYTQRGRQVHGTIRLRLANLAKQELAIRWYLLLPWRQRNMREMRVDGPNPNLFKGQIPEGFEIDRPEWVLEELKKNPKAEFWLYRFTAEENKNRKADLLRTSKTLRAAS